MVKKKKNIYRNYNPYCYNLPQANCQKLLSKPQIILIIMKQKLKVFVCVSVTECKATEV